MLRHRFLRSHRLFHGFPHESPFHKGDLKYVVLDLLQGKPKYGYEIIRALEEQSHGFYRPSPGVVYPTLQMLEEMGYASSTERDGKKVYTITGEGRHFLDERSDWTDEIRSHMRHHWNPKHFVVIGGIMDEVDKIVESVGSGARNAAPGKLDRIKQVISKTHQEIEAILQE